MSSPSRSRSKKGLSRRPLLLALLGVVVVLLLGGYAWHHHTNSQKNPTTQAPTTAVNTINYSPAPAADNNANEARKGSSTPSATLGNGSSSSSSSAKFTVEIVNASVNNGNLHVGTLVSGITSGTCSLTATKSGQTIQLKTSAVVQDVNTYDCGPINVSTSSFPSSGNWNLTLTVSNNGSQASSNYSVTI